MISASYKLLITVFIILGFYILSIGQANNTISILSPSGNSAEYCMVPGVMSDSVLLVPIQGEIEFGIDSADVVTDGCTELTNSLNGKICFLDRGGCSFVDKFRNAEEANAIALIVCNNEDAEPIVMGGGQSNIFAAMISMEDCNEIRAELENGPFEVGLTYVEKPCILEVDSLIVWGQNGEGSFGDGLGEWIASDSLGGDNTFIYVEESSGSGAIIGPNIKIDSPTACNGAIIADFDFFTTQGSSDTLSALTPPFPTYTGHLTSPTIDLTNVQNPVVHFYQLQILRPNQDFCSFQYSIDDGDTWSEKEIIETENVFTPSVTVVVTEDKSIEISEAANQSKVKLRFSYQGADFYFWTLDDIYITGDLVLDTEEILINDIQVELGPNPTNGLVYISLREPLQEDFTISVFNTSGQVVHTENHNKGVIECEIDIKDKAQGLYVISIVSGGIEVVRKVIVE